MDTCGTNAINSTSISPTSLSQAAPKKAPDATLAKKKAKVANAAINAETAQILILPPYVTFVKAHSHRAVSDSNYVRF